MSDTGYLSFPQDTDVDALQEQAFDAVRGYFPDWEPNESHLETALIEATAQNTSVAAAVAKLVPAEIFRYSGRTLNQIAPIDRASATVPTTWTLLDSLGHTITAGTQVAYRVDGDTIIPFSVQTDVVVAPGDNSTSTDEVILEAVVPGSEASGLAAGPFELIDSLSWVSSIVSASTTAGGVDAESDDDYLDRLRTELQLLSPRPILANDFAVLARRIAGVGRSTAIDNYDPGTNEVQRIATTGTPTGGTFTLTYSGQTTASIAYNANSATVQAALEALSNISVGDVAVTGGALPSPVFVTFKGLLATADVPAMTSTDSLTGGTSPATVLTTPTSGAAASTGNERMVTVAVAAADGTALDGPTKIEVQDYLDAQREVNFVVHVIDPTYTTVAVDATIKVLSGYDITAVETACETALTDYLSPDAWDWAGTVYVNELIALLSNVEGVDRVVSTSPSSDISLGGVAALPMAGTMSVVAV